MPWISRDKLDSLNYKVDRYIRKSDRLHRRCQKAEGDLAKVLKAFKVLKTILNTYEIELKLEEDIHE